MIVHRILNLSLVAAVAATAACTHVEAKDEPVEPKASARSTTPTSGALTVVDDQNKTFLNEPCTPEEKAQGRRPAKPQVEVGVTVKPKGQGQGSDVTPYAGHRCNQD